MTRRSPKAIVLPSGYRSRFKVVEEKVAVGAESFVLARPRDAEDLISEKDFDLDERLPYWAELWPSAVALGESLLDSTGPTTRDPCRAIELGCGVGLVACCAVRSGFELTVTDYYDDAVAFAAANVLANTGQRVAAHHLDWRHLADDLGRFDVVLAADVLYEREYGALVPSVVCRLLVPGGTAWIADPGRVGASLFVEEAESLGARVASTNRTVTVRGSEHDITIYELTAP